MYWDSRYDKDFQRKKMFTPSRQPNVNEFGAIQMSPVFSPDMLKKGLEEWIDDFTREQRRRDGKGLVHGPSLVQQTMIDGAKMLFEHLYRMGYEAKPQPIKLEINLDYGKSMLEEFFKTHVDLNQVTIVGKPCKVQINVTIPKSII